MFGRPRGWMILLATGFIWSLDGSAQADRKTAHATTLGAFYVCVSAHSDQDPVGTMDAVLGIEKDVVRKNRGKVDVVEGSRVQLKNGNATRVPGAGAVSHAMMTLLLVTPGSNSEAGAVHDSVRAALFAAKRNWGRQHPRVTINFRTMSTRRPRSYTPVGKLLQQRSPRPL